MIRTMKVLVHIRHKFISTPLLHAILTKQAMGLVLRKDSSYRGREVYVVKVCPVLSCHNLDSSEFRKRDMGASRIQL